ncbi:MULTISPECIES: ABC transporter ATP-binding protein [unclassified Beijerinckia]|uniref:ABC transporter ATP-binding protein n=1 Tax=unclassified Beijerinckia TaxID=2638183 RepID=UPI000896024D|nr:MULTISPECIES: ABC transporter ATP-binding protein [unclassified Beijerinckia]MDH7795976.1 NitT/TauT family transport system ATP-binding protein [Beijerinckia sp. GAS462]SEC24647.1 NitT/TauT family transport system ATP-binding protein [Beijerinckia sp. 28-YEA-48]
MAGNAALEPTGTGRRNAIEAAGIGMVYETFTALDNVSFNITEGEFVAVVGPSGCGKSTLLQILGGLLSATHGKVLIDDEPVTKPQPGKIAIVFQDALLLPWKSALENIEFPLELQKFPRAERREKALAMLDLVGLSDFSHAQPHEMSGGMRQRISIARGLAQDPRIILMDEPFGALDEQTRIKMGEELLRIWERTRKTIFFITHSLTEAIYLSDTVLIMGRKPGRIVETLKVQLPRPRHIDMMGSEEFGRARNHIWRLLSQE